MNRKAKLELHSKVTTNDGTGLFVRLIQHPCVVGKMPIVLNDGLGCDGFIWKHFINYFQHQHPIIHWHYRGHGYSETPEDLNSINIPQFANDMKAVLDHLQVDQAFVCGHSMGVQVTLEAFRQFGERFTGMGLLCGSFEHPLETWHGSQKRGSRPTLLNFAMNQLFPAFYSKSLEYQELLQPLWGILMNTDLPYQIAMLTEVNRNLVKREDFSGYFEHLSSMQAHVFFKTMKSYAEHSARQVLSKINKPTLVVSGGQDTFSPHWVSLDMHHAIDKSELLYIPDGTHCAPIEHPELLHLRLEKFLWSTLTQASSSSCKNTIDTSMHEPAWKQQKATVNI